MDVMITYLAPIFVIVIIVAGIILVTMGGSSSSYVELVKNILTYAIIGLIIALLAFVFLRILSGVL